MPDRYGTFGSYLADTLESNRQFARQYGDDQALKAYAANPNDPSAIAQLTARNPGIVTQLQNAQTGSRNAAVAERTQAGLERGAGVMAGLLNPNGPLANTSPTSIVASTVARPGGGVIPPGQPNAPAAAPNAPADPNEIVVQANRPQPTHAEAMAQLIQADPTGKMASMYGNLRQNIGQMDKADRDALSAKADTWAAIGSAIEGLPEQAARDYVDAHRAEIKAHDITDAEIDAHDYSPESTRLQTGLAIGAKGLLAEKDRAATLAETARGHDLTASSAAAGRALTARGQNMADARARDANKANGGKLTEFQGKATGFYARALQAEDVLGNSKVIPGAGARMADNLPFGLGSAVNGSDVQQNMAARQAFVQSVLRMDSGAAIGKDEYTAAEKVYFPSRGDSKATIAQKAQLRKTAIDGLKIAAGPGAAQVVNPGLERPIRVKDDAGYAALESGQVFVGPDGKRRRKQ